MIKKVFVCSLASARTVEVAQAQLQALIITIQPDMILLLRLILQNKSNIMSG